MGPFLEVPVPWSPYIFPAVFPGRPIPEVAVGEVPNESWPSKNKQRKKHLWPPKNAKKVVVANYEKRSDFWWMIFQLYKFTVVKSPGIYNTETLCHL